MPGELRGPPLPCPGRGAQKQMGTCGGRGLGRRGRPTPHLETGRAVQGAARPAALPPAPAAARTGPTPRPPVGLGAVRSAPSPASREPERGQGGQRKRLCSAAASIPGQQGSGLPKDLATLRPEELRGQSCPRSWLDLGQPRSRVPETLLGTSTTFSWSFPQLLPATRVCGMNSCLPSHGEQAPGREGVSGLEGT